MKFDPKRLDHPVFEALLEVIGRGKRLVLWYQLTGLSCLLVICGGCWLDWPINFVMGFNLVAIAGWLLSLGWVGAPVIRFSNTESHLDLVRFILDSCLYLSTATGRRAAGSVSSSQVTTVFCEAFRTEGGPWRPDERLEHFVEGLCDPIRERVYIGFVESDRVNARVRISNGYVLIGLYRGFENSLRALSDTLEATLDASRRDMLFSIGVMFCVYHEMGHVENHHLEYRGGRGLSMHMDEDPRAPNDDRLSAEESQALEIDADLFAISVVLGTVGHFVPKDVVYAILLVFTVFAEVDPSVDDWDESHPHLLVRMFGVMIAIHKHSLVEEGVDIKASVDSWELLLEECLKTFVSACCFHEELRLKILDVLAGPDFELDWRRAKEKYFVVAKHLVDSVRPELEDLGQHSA